MLGLRVTETCNARITDLQCVGGDKVLHVLGKGAKPADIPCPSQVLRAVRAATAGRTMGYIVQSAQGQPLTRGAASRLLAQVVTQAGLSGAASSSTARFTAGRLGRPRLASGTWGRRTAPSKAPALRSG